MSKYFKCIILIIAICIFCSIPSFAATDEQIHAADELYVLGLFNGTGTDSYGNPIYSLDKKPTREESMALLIRILGKEDEALSGQWETPFDDLSSWAEKYVGYAYANGLTNGMSATKFGSISLVNERQYCTLLVRALGYKDNEDFTYNEIYKLTDRLGLTNGENSSFTRGDVCTVSVKALDTKIKTGEKNLLDTISSVNDEKLWHRENAKKAAENTVEAQTIKATAKWNGVSKYNLPKELGEQTLFYDEAYSLVGRAPVIVQNRVKTFADVLQYSIAAGFGADNDVFTPWYSNSNESWGYDYPGEVQLVNNWITCCGGATNYVNYLLKGDYDSQGWIQYLGGGNHHFNWILTNGKYYILDLTKYICMGRYSDTASPIIQCDSIKDFFENKWPSYYADKADITQCYYATEDGISTPANFCDDKLIFVPSLQGKIEMIYSAKGALSKFAFKEPTMKIPGYNTYYDIKATNQDTIDEITSKMHKIIAYDTDWAPISLVLDDGRILSTSGIGFSTENNSNISGTVLFNGSETDAFTLKIIDSRNGKVTKNGSKILFSNAKSGYPVIIEIQIENLSMQIRWYI